MTPPIASSIMAMSANGNLTNCRRIQTTLHTYIKGSSTQHPCSKLPTNPPPLCIKIAPKIKTPLFNPTQAILGNKTIKYSSIYQLHCHSRMPCILLLSKNSNKTRSSLALSGITISTRHISLMITIHRLSHKLGRYSPTQSRDIKT
jgi:hypothetical protein